MDEGFPGGRRGVEERLQAEERGNIRQASALAPEPVVCE